MVDLSPEQLKEINREFYDVAVLLGVNIPPPSDHSLYTKQELDQVRDAFDRAIGIDNLELSDGENPYNSPEVKIAIYKLVKSLEEKYDNDPDKLALLARSGKVIYDAVPNMAVIDKIADSVEHNLQQGFYNLANVLGVELGSPQDNPDEISYTQEEIEHVRKAYNLALLQTQAAMGPFLDSSDEMAVRIALANNIIASVGNRDAAVNENIRQVVIQAPEIMDYLVAKAGGQLNAELTQDPVSATADAVPQGAQAQYRVEVVPERSVPQDVRASVRELKESLFKIIEGINESDASANIPFPDDKNNIDGIPDEQFFQSYQATLSYITGMIENAMTVDGFLDVKSKTARSIYPEAANVKQTGNYTPELRNKVEILLRQYVRDGDGDPAVVTEMFNQLDLLHSRGFLSDPVGMVEKRIPIAPTANNSNAIPTQEVSPSVNVTNAAALDASQGNDSTPSSEENSVGQSQEDEIKIKEAIKDIEGLLISIGDVGDLPGVGKFISKIGLADKLYTPLTVADGKFGAHEQDLMSKLIMLMKTIDGQEGANGYYSEAIGHKLQLSILTKPEFSFIRDNENINVRFYGDDEESIKLAQDLLNFERIKKPADDASEQEKAAYKQNQEFYEKHKEELRSIARLSNIFDSMNILTNTTNTKFGKYDNKKAAQVTQYNMMMDMVSSFLPDGMKTWLKDFFVNSEIGQMLGDFLGAFMGFDVARLWGEGRVDFDPVEDSLKSLGEKFGETIDKIKAANPDMAFADQMKLVTKDIMGGKLSGGINGLAAQAALVLAVGRDETDFINAAIEEALEAAEAGRNKGEAVDIFLLKLDEIGSKYRNNSEVTIDDEVFVKPDARSSVEIRRDIATQAKVLEANGVEFTGREIDAEFIELGENKNIALVFTPDTTNWERELYPSNGVVRNIQDVLARNKDALGISLDPKMMMKEDGTTFTDTMNIGTNAFIEEMLIRAQIYSLVEEGVKITPEVLSGLGGKLTRDNLPIVELYMSAKGVSGEDIEAFRDKVTYMMDNSPEGRLDSLWDITNIGGQFKLNMAQFAPQVVAGVAVAPVVNSGDNNADPLRDRYLNYERNGSTNLSKVPCDVPVFYVENGSVYALIREKSEGRGDSNPYDDTYRVLEIKDYIENRSIDDAATLRALQDNYKWNDSSKEGIEAFLDKILCLEPVAPEMKTAPVVEQKQTVSSLFNNSSCGVGKRESFKDLCRLNSDQAAILKERGLDVEKLFTDAIPVKDNGVSQFVILVPKDHGITGVGVPDFIVAMRDGADIDYRVGNYVADGLVPFETQKMAGMADIGQIRAPVGDLRIDDLLSVISVSSGGSIRSSASSANGYLGMSFIVPDGNGGVKLENGLRAVYGDIVDEKNAVSKYSEAYHSRSNAIGAYRQVLRDSKVIGTLRPESRSIYISAGQDAAADVGDDVSKPKEESWFRKLFGGSSEDSSDINAKIKQNAGDMDVGSANEDVYNPNNADLLKLARPTGYAAGASAR